MQVFVTANYNILAQRTHIVQRHIALKHMLAHKSHLAEQYPIIAHLHDTQYWTHIEAVEIPLAQSNST